MNKQKVYTNGMIMKPLANMPCLVTLCDSSGWLSGDTGRGA